MTAFNKVVFRLLFFILIFHTSADLLSQSGDSVKCWSEQDKLRWSDFRGEKPKLSSHTASTLCRLTPIPSFKNEILSYRVDVVFKRYGSWKTDAADYLLDHEQLHFDIIELHARKLRSRISRIANKIPHPTEQDFRSVIEATYLEISKMQKAYDEDTLHGVIDENQHEWELKIRSALRELSSYASTPADCK